MATQVQFRGGTTVEHSTFTGAAREITIDTDKDTVVVHDGATAGGYPLAKEDGATFINVDINSGTIDGTTIGATTPSTVSATDLTATGTTTLAGADTSADITFGDNVKATFGIGSDLQIYHDGADSRIVEAGTGNLKIQSDANTSITDAAGTTISARFRPTTHVSLYYNSSEKLATTSTGITVTGTVTADGLALSDNILRDVDNNSMFISGGNAASTGANIGLYGSTSGNPNDILLRRNNVKFAAFDGATGDISFYEDTGTTAKFFWDASAERLGVGTSSPSNALHVNSGTTNQAAFFESSDATVQVAFADNSTATYFPALGAAGQDLFLKGGGSASRHMTIDSSGNVGIGTSSPSAPLHVAGDARIGAGTGDASLMGMVGSGDNFKITTSSSIGTVSFDRNVGIGTSSPASSVSGSAKMLQIEHNNFAGIALNNTGAGTKFEIASLAADGLGFYDNGTHRMRIDSGGRLLVGKTASSSSTAGGTLEAGSILGVVSGGQCLRLNRLSSHGDIIQLWKDGGNKGSFGTESVGTFQLVAETVDFYIRPNSGNSTASNTTWIQSSIVPWNDNYFDLGRSGYRWDDIYATNGTIQTSDQNEKQQIASLTDAEITAAKAISKLFKTFKWNDSVAEKGDAARTHTGVIAQEVEQAMTDAGLDAGDYAFFISTTWWETQTEVPAVAAVEAVEATYDEEGNVLTEAVEAVEGKEAYTRTDTYETAEEAPEGATERNRKGIRYPQLLSFIGAATEQRLASIESRLDALEGS